MYMPVYPGSESRERKNESGERGKTLRTSESLLLNWANQIWNHQDGPVSDWQTFKTSNFSSVAVPLERPTTFQCCGCLRAREKAHKQIMSPFSVMCVTDYKFFGWYMVFMSHGSRVVHTLSYLLFSVAPDLLYCRCMGENRQLFTAS